MFVAAQYYRAPFPHRRFWADDFSRIRDAGLDAVQLWALWGWIESTPDVYNYEDYDELVAQADKKGLKVIISTIAEIHPFWIHRLVPGSEMVDHMGNKVVSSLRCECNVGLTPGGCFDHPKVAELMRNFLTDIAAHFANAANLLAWDCWNETRWAVDADGHVCYCPNTLREFRSWLSQRHGGLEGLNAAWQRRYVDWADVRPGKLPTRPYTDMVEFLRFLTVRAARHAEMRYSAIRDGDPKRMISAHCATPATQSAGGGFEQALCRGVDWDLADRLDGFGSSHFPFWGRAFDDDWMGLRLEAVRSANQGRKVTWISEYHGGSARDAILAHEQVDPVPQQRGVINGLARAAKGVIFWCWRDEVFGRESSGFGFDGSDGLADQRIAAMKKTASMLKRHNDLIDGYMPAPAKVGVLFVPDNYLLNWAEKGNANSAMHAVNGYAMALEHMRIPYEFVEARHLDALDQLDVLLMPWCLILPKPTRAAIVEFVKRGGRILYEAETDAFDELAFYRYPHERPMSKAMGLHDLGRRKCEADSTIPIELGGQMLELASELFTTPLRAGKAEVLAYDENDQPLIARQAVGNGAAYAVGAFLGQKYFRGENADLKQLILHVCDDAGVRPAFDIDAGDGNAKLYWRHGKSGRTNMLWITSGGPERRVTVKAGAASFGRDPKVRELFTGRQIKLTGTGKSAQFAVHIPAGGFAVLAW